MIIICLLVRMLYSEEVFELLVYLPIFIIIFPLYFVHIYKTRLYRYKERRWWNWGKPNPITQLNLLYKNKILQGIFNQLGNVTPFEACHYTVNDSVHGCS